MKNIVIILACILLVFSNQQKLSLTTHTTEKYKMSSKTWQDLLNVEVDCPFNGVIKNFVLRTDGSSLWYEYQCYSSLSEESDEGEPIIKRLTLTTRYRGTVYISSNINTLNSFPVDCWADYGLKSFKLIPERSGYYSSYLLKREAVCHGIKPSYTSPINVVTEKGTCDTSNFYTSSHPCLFNILVGSTDIENDVDIGYPLRGFKYFVDNSYSQRYPTVYYKYSYAILRNMKVVKDFYSQKFQQLRDSNTQKN